MIEEVAILKLYSKDDCPRCDMIKDKLISKNVQFIEIKDEDIIKSLCIEFLPVLEVDGQLLGLSKANDYINSL